MIAKPKAVNRTPRAALADWANDKEEWLRQMVEVVLATDAPLADDAVKSVFQLFLQENGLIQRTLPPVPNLAAAGEHDPEQPALSMTRLANVLGVNALVPGQSVSFNAGLTLLFGENATGKTGYARILKALAGSRSIDEILPDIADTETQVHPSADIEYRLGDQALTHSWRGERNIEPFNRTLVFDNPAAALHLEEALTYSFQPASLALIGHVTNGIHGVQGEIDEFADRLRRTDLDLHERFDKDSSLYPKIESLGPKTNLQELRQLSSLPDDATSQTEKLRRRVAALKAGLPRLQIALQTRLRRVLMEAESFTSAVGAFQVEEHSTRLRRLSRLQQDLTQLRDGLFAAADLPADPEETWETFIRAGNQYRQHLETVGKHDETRCLYCRQTLNDTAIRLIERYREYLDDRIAKDIAVEEERIRDIGSEVLDAQIVEVSSFVEEMRAAEEPDSQVAPKLLQLLVQVTENEKSIRENLEQNRSLTVETLKAVKKNRASLATALSEVDSSLEQLDEQVTDQSKLLEEAEAALAELEARLRLKELWPRVAQRVKNLRHVAKLTDLRTVTSNRLRQLTELSKSLSEEMANRNFAHLFRIECRALRAPRVELDFVGRQGQVRRRKAVRGSHRPSEVFSEGEQKVLALSDFLAEARLHGPVGPIVLDDPVSSLDYRRIAEVAIRIADLANDHQVIVFTHDIFFATHLLTHFEGSPRLSYYRVSDEGGTGHVDPATGPRTDTLKSLRGEVNAAIQNAESASGEARTEMVRQGYSRIRAWCEIFIESEMLAGVTQRYQPNVRTTALTNIKTSKLDETIEIVVRVFEDASRYMPGHSQPPQHLAVTPTLDQLEEDWRLLQECRRNYRQGD
ncbi:MAG: AAA family ATPase [Chloroflexi bacterium]|nr:AAA family ATPase [Chloroflexota bacterium]